MSRGVLCGKPGTVNHDGSFSTYLRARHSPRAAGVDPDLQKTITVNSRNEGTRWIVDTRICVRGSGLFLFFFFDEVEAQLRLLRNQGNRLGVREFEIFKPPFVQ